MADALFWCTYTCFLTPMNNAEKEEVRRAVNALILSPQAHEWYESLRAVSSLAERYPVLLTEGAEAINPLLRLWVSDRRLYDVMIALVERKREELGYDPLQRVKVESKKRRAAKYMAPFMEAKRDRQRRAVEAENVIRGEKDKLIGNARIEFMLRQGATWKTARDAFLEKIREANGGVLKRPVMQAALAQFWASVDADLDEREKAARGEAIKPASQRRIPDVSMEALTAALEFDPYTKPK